MPFNRSTTYTNRIGAAAKVGLLFDRRYLRTLPWPWRVLMTGLGWVVLGLILLMAAAPLVMIAWWLLGSLR